MYSELANVVPGYAVYLLDPVGAVFNWNSSAQRLKGYDADEVLGHSISMFYTAEDRRSGLPDRAISVATTEGRFENEGWRVRKDGSLFWAAVLIQSLRNSAGELLGFGKIVRDASRSKAADVAGFKSAFWKTLPYELPQAIPSPLIGFPRAW